ncbi:hypothetical protein DAPPUDRAFT_262596 [Daphnia pulex]|uniref:Uncharacterized protein n=1 Tax=Daphnia pulex TaxID=6669 RepID=E9HN93_DAPPU|nr:hypothetical protein DAPPUDRAFT_262596 [Daphnia pulex]|eukprot:EFX66799.1 hypothetical protein DAPPUDRAFT_262596 [Daphnia pulex]
MWLWNLDNIEAQEGTDDGEIANKAITHFQHLMEGCKTEAAGSTYKEIQFLVFELCDVMPPPEVQSICHQSTANTTIRNQDDMEAQKETDDRNLLSKEKTEQKNTEQKGEGQTNNLINSSLNYVNVAQITDVFRSVIPVVKDFGNEQLILIDQILNGFLSSVFGTNIDSIEAQEGSDDGEQQLDKAKVDKNTERNAIIEYPTDDTPAIEDEDS